MSRQLMDAAARGNLAKLAEQLAAGADVNYVHKATGRHPLIEAVVNGQLEAVDALIAAGAHVNHCDSATGYSALMWACAGGNQELVERLLAAGADVGVRSNLFGWTPLLCAARVSLPIVQRLIVAGADPHAAMNDGRTAVALARSARRTEIAEALEALSVSADNALPGVDVLPWPNVGENGEDVDFTSPESVVRGLIIAMHRFETEAHRTDDHPTGLKLMADAYARFCTVKERPYGRNGSYQAPPEYDPDQERLIESKVPRPARAEVTTRNFGVNGCEYLYVLARKSGRWLVDSKKTRNVGERDWRAWSI